MLSVTKVHKLALTNVCFNYSTERIFCQVFLLDTRACPIFPHTGANFFYGILAIIAFHFFPSLSTSFQNPRTARFCGIFGSNQKQRRLTPWRKTKLEKSVTAYRGSKRPHPGILWVCPWCNWQCHTTKSGHEKISIIFSDADFLCKSTFIETSSNDSPLFKAICSSKGFLVEHMRLELMTSSMPSKRSSQLS